MSFAPRLVALTLAVLASASLPALAADELSPAEKAIFTANHVANIKPPTTLNYTFRKTGTLEEAYQDTVAVNFKAQADGSCCSSSGQFLSGARQVPLPEIEIAKANPVILYFLEHDIREMHRLTKGSENYFRKRIRMAVFQGATITPTSFRYKGKSVAGQQIVLKPYTDDPNRSRYEKLSDKEYRFMLSDAVPGSVFGIRTEIAGLAGAPAQITEELLIDGAEFAPPPRAP